MNKFTHGIMVVDPASKHEDGTLPVVHFVGYWSEPQEKDFEEIMRELENDPEFGLIEIADRLEYYDATKDCLEYFNSTTDFDKIEEGLAWKG